MEGDEVGGLETGREANTLVQERDHEVLVVRLKQWDGQEETSRWDAMWRMRHGEELGITTGIWIRVTSTIYQERRVQELYARAHVL